MASQAPLNAAPKPQSRASTADQSNPSPGRLTKNIVLCLDGTGKHFSHYNTNVIKLFGALVKTKPEKQVVYYQTGIGTSVNTNKSLISPIVSSIDSVVDLAFGWYLDSHVIEAYKFVQSHYLEGDRICIFGYSRGAYTARALCGFLHAIGILPKSNIHQVHYAYQIWKTGDKIACKYYKHKMSIDANVEFLGCFDTVSSVGIIIPRVLPFSQFDGKTHVFRHALALDEHRVKFRQETWHYVLSSKSFSIPNWIYDTVTASIDYATGLFTPSEHKWTPESHEEAAKHLKDYKEPTRDRTDVKEVWFAGGHSDIGGGAMSDFHACSLSNIPLHWMMKEALKARSGILFDADAALSFGFNVPHEDDIAPGVEFDDAIFFAKADGNPGLVPELRKPHVAAPSHSPLGPIWWPLELIPVLERKQAKGGEWVMKPRINLFRPRTIPSIDPPEDPDEKKRWYADRRAGSPTPGLLFHQTVLERMNLDIAEYPDASSRSLVNPLGCKKYQPYAKLPNGLAPTYVE